ncbi:MAG: tetratricopeptide repeat protein [Sandaracinaceae bacterium]|nr:tetratricopeptide repeat protein [Sandaracinaceae bacterium]
MAVELLEREAEERASGGEVPIELWLRVFDQAMVGGLGEKAAAALARLRAARPSERERVEVSLREARGLAARGEADGARSLCRGAREEARGLGMAAVEVELTLVEADVESRYGDANAGAALYAGAAEQARALGDAALEARAHLGASVVAMYLGKNAGVHDHALAALVAAQRSGDPVLTSESQRALGNAHRERGELVDSLRCYENAVRTARASGAIENEAKALNNFGVDATRLGRLSDAIEACRRAIRLKERLGAEASADVTRNNLAYLLGAIGEHEEAGALLDAVIARATGNAGELIARANLAELAVQEGRVDEGVAALEAADAISEQRGLTQFRGQLGAALARALTMRGAAADLARAASILAAMASYADQAPTEQGRYAVAEALLWDRRGEHERAEACARHAVSHGLRGAYLFGCLGSRLEAIWVHAVALGRLGRTAEAGEQGSKALLTLTWLGASLDGEAARRRMLDASALHRTIRAARLDVPVGHSWHPEA